ncbi:MAG: HD domain-containing protein, partial [bacterium]
PLTKLLSFTKFTHSFQKIERRIFATGLNRNENDLEHSGQLALVAWYFIDSSKLKLNTEKVIKYALAHDLVETYAGDTYFYSKDKKIQESKVQREKNALVRIKKEFPDFKEIEKIITKYEEKSDPESRFVYALDKIIPVLNIYLDEGRSWKRDNVSL